MRATILRVRGVLIGRRPKMKTIKSDKSPLRLPTSRSEAFEPVKEATREEMKITTR